VAPPRNAHDYALQQIRDARDYLGESGIPDSGRVKDYVLCFDGWEKCQSFSVGNNGDFLGENISEHDAFLLLFSQEMKQRVDLARQVAEQEAEKKDHPPSTLKGGGKLYTIKDQDLWNPYVLGDTNCYTHKIRTLDNYGRKREVVLHEMMHVATNCSEEPGLHRLINQMAPKLLELMQENPSMVKYLMSDPVKPQPRKAASRAQDWETSSSDSAAHHTQPAPAPQYAGPIRWTRRDCYSLSASYNGVWKPLSTAPKDGSVVEILETRGYAPMYGLFRWGDFGGMQSWVSVKESNIGHSDTACAFWRPYTGNPRTYVDPTGGRQNTTKYWCDAERLRYDAKKDRCF
jgi:hypothetical protein